MRRALIASLALHLSVGAVLAFALGRPRPAPVEEVIAVDLVAAPRPGPAAEAKAPPAEAAPLPPREAAAPPPPVQPVPEEPPAEPSKAAPAPPPRPAPPEPRPPAPLPPAPPEPKLAAPTPQPERPQPEPPRAKPAPPRREAATPAPAERAKPDKPAAEQAPAPKPKAKPAEPAPPAKVASKAPVEPNRPPEPAKEDSFTALLRSVEKLERRVRAEQASPGRGRAEPQSVPTQGEAARAEATLTQGEVDAIRRQIERCWNVPVGVRGIETMQVRLRIAMNRDGSVARVGIEDQARMAVDPAFRTVAESAQRAVLSCQLVLPPEKYDQWREMVMTFHPKDALSG